MKDDTLEKIFEHNNWANQRIIQACSALSAEQLDADPCSVTVGSIRAALTHLVGSQKGYLSLLTLPLEARHAVRDSGVVPAFSELQELAQSSGEGLLALARHEPVDHRLQTRDGYFVEAWVVMLQAINHATEHREQICSMLSALGVTPPDLDGWSYGESTHALSRFQREEDPLMCEYVFTAP